MFFPGLLMFKSEQNCHLLIFVKIFFTHCDDLIAFDWMQKVYQVTISVGLFCKAYLNLLLFAAYLILIKIIFVKNIFIHCDYSVILVQLEKNVSKFENSFGLSIAAY